MFVHILLAWHSSWMDRGGAEPTGCDPFPDPFTPPAPQGRCIHTNKNRPNPHPSAVERLRKNDSSTIVIFRIK